MRQFEMGFGSKILGLGLLVVMTGCSLFGDKESSVQTKQTDNWFECRAAASGVGWICDDDVDAESIVVATSPEPVAVTVSEPPTDNQAVEASGYSDPLYSIQLAAFRSEERRRNYVQQHDFDDAKLIFVEEQRGDQQWWLLLYGEYMSTTEAREAQQQLAESFGITDSWVKPRH